MKLIELFNKYWADPMTRTIAITVLICAVLFSMCGCTKTEAPECQNCHTQEWIMSNGQWVLIHNMGFVDCNLVVRNEDRTYEASGDLYKRITRCVR